MNKFDLQDSKMGSFIKKNLSDDFLKILTFIVFTVLSLSIFICAFNYNSYVDEKNKKLIVLGQETHKEISEFLLKNEEILKHIGSKIYDLDSKNLTEIDTLLKDINKINDKKEQFLIKWIRPDGKILVDGQEGQLKEVLMDSSFREYSEFCRKNPGTIKAFYIKNKDFYKSSALRIVSGVEDNQGKFSGYVSLEIKMKDFIEKIKNNETNFILIDDDFNLITSSIGNLNFDRKIFEKPSKDIIKNNDLIFNAISFEKNIFSFSRKIENYPYFLIFGIDKNSFEHEFYLRISPFISSFIFVGLCVSLISFILRKRIINPVLALAKVSVGIAHGETNIKIPKQNSVEMLELAKGLVLVKRLIKRDQMYKKKLHLANQAIEKSDEERKNFIKNINREFKNHLKDILIYVDLLIIRENSDRFLPKDNSIKSVEYLNKIKETVLYINSRIPRSLNLSYVNFNNIMRQAIQVNLRSLKQKNIDLVENLLESIPKIYGDELRLKHLIVSLIAKCIENLTINTKIRVSTRVKSENSINFLEIIISDNGFGLTEKELKAINTNIGAEESDFEFDIMSEESIESLIKMHHGKYYVNNKRHRGKDIILKFPVLKKEDFYSFKYDNDQKNDNIFYLF